MLPRPAATTGVAPNVIADLAGPPVAPLDPLPLRSTMPAPSPVTRAPESRAPENPVDDEQLVLRTLQRYRTAYDGLDAQRLTFDACEVALGGEVANATCRGSMRYVATIGSREPRTEPRVWKFTLKKLDGDWKIERARAEP